MQLDELRDAEKGEMTVARLICDSRNKQHPSTSEIYKKRPEHFLSHERSASGRFAIILTPPVPGAFLQG